MQYSLPVILDYDGRKHLATMGPFERSLERDFSLAVNKKAIEDCDDMAKLKEVATNLLMGWSNMQGAIGSLVKENMQLRHAMAMRESDLRAAEQLLNEVAMAAPQQASDPSSRLRRASRPNWNLWPW